MPPNKNPESERSSGKPDDASRLLRAIENTEVERRMSNLENSVGKLESSLLERHARLITIIFSCMTAFVAVCAILVTVLGLLSKSETREAAKEMRVEVKEAISDMGVKFQALAGEALKKPAIQILTANGLLEGHVLEVTPGSVVPLGALFIKNVGEKRTDPVSIRLYCSANVHAIGWSEFASIEPNFPK